MNSIFREKNTLSVDLHPDKKSKQPVSTPCETIITGNPITLFLLMIMAGNDQMRKRWYATVSQSYF